MAETHEQALLRARVEVVLPKYIKRGDKILIRGFPQRDGKRMHMPRLVEHVSVVSGEGFVFHIAPTEREFGGQEVVSEHDTILRVKRMADICGVICECGPNGEPLACGYPDGHEGAHAWASMPTWVDRWRIVHLPHRNPKKASVMIEGPSTGSRIVYGVAMDHGVPVHERSQTAGTDA